MADVNNADALRHYDCAMNTWHCGLGRWLLIWCFGTRSESVDPVTGQQVVIRRWRGNDYLWDWDLQGRGVR